MSISTVLLNFTGWYTGWFNHNPTEMAAMLKLWLSVLCTPIYMLTIHLLTTTTGGGTGTLQEHSPLSSFQRGQEWWRQPQG